MCLTSIFTVIHLQQCYRYYKLRSAPPPPPPQKKKKKRHYESVSNFKVGLKPLLQQGLSEPEFYGDLFKEIVSRAVFSDQIRKLTIRGNCIGYNINVMWQNACFAVNPITLNKFSSLLIALWLAGHQPH